MEQQVASTPSPSPFANHPLYKNHLKELEKFKNGERKREPKIYTCEQCKYITNRQNDYKVHEISKKHKNGGKFIKILYECEPCQYKTFAKNQYNIHVMSKKHNFNCGI